MLKTLLHDIAHITISFCLIPAIRPKSATHRAVEDKVFSLVTASIQSDDESGKANNIIKYWG